MNTHDILLAFSLTLLAGLSTGIGSLIAFLSKRTNEKFLSFAMGLSAGVMIYVSFMELLPESVHSLTLIEKGTWGTFYALLTFFAGIGFIALIDLLIPEDENPHEFHLKEEKKKPGLHRTGILLALAIGIHNFPEGLAVFTSALTHSEIAIPIVFAIAIHNIPEGMAVSVPIYFSTNNRKKAFWYSFLSGLAEPMGALLGFAFLAPFWTESLNAYLLAFVAGIMVYISFDELLPSTEQYGHHHWGVMGIVLGMIIMAGSLLFL